MVKELKWLVDNGPKQGFCLGASSSVAPNTTARTSKNWSKECNTISSMGGGGLHRLSGIAGDEPVRRGSAALSVFCASAPSSSENCALPLQIRAAISSSCCFSALLGRLFVTSSNALSSLSSIALRRTRLSTIAGRSFIVRRMCGCFVISVIFAVVVRNVLITEAITSSLAPSSE